MAAALPLAGQTIPGRNISDGITPPAVAAGAPPGVKELSSLERINLFNGSLSLSIPLMTVGGRGEAGYSMEARVESAPWTVSMDTAPFCPTPEGCTGFTHTSAATNREQMPFAAPYTPGVIYAKRSGVTPFLCATAGTTRYSQTFTHIVFESPDGSQTQLWDGAALGVTGCGGSGGGMSRGPVFRALGDSNLVFVSTAPLTDSDEVLDADKYVVSGKLLFGNGVEYTVVNGVVTRITDRNGNYVELTYYGASTLVQFIQDSLGRTISVQHDVLEAGIRVDKISYFGAAGKERAILVERVRTNPLPVRSDLPSTGNSFGSVSISYSNFDRLLKKITLPDGRLYTFQYTRFGEPARLELPSGAAIEYDHGAGLANAGLVPGTYTEGAVLDNPGTRPNDSNSDPGWRPAVYRRLLKRRTYPAGGTGATSVEAETSYSRRESASAPITAGGITSALTITVLPYVVESTTGKDLAVPLETRHSFLEAPPYGLAPVQTMLLPPSAIKLPNTFNAYEGTPYKTEIPGLQSVEKIFRVSDVQRKALRLCQETTLVGNSTSKRVERLYAHDAYGNVTDTYEYDFEKGPVFQSATTSTPAACAPPNAAYARRTLKTYKTGDYATDANHLFGLTDTEIVYNAGDNATAQTTYEYDQRPLLDKESSSITRHDSAAYPTSRVARGNVTAVRRSTGPSTSLTTALQYDLLGNLRRMLPPHLVTQMAGYTGSASLEASTTAARWSYADQCDSDPGLTPGAGFATAEQLPPATTGATAFTTSTRYDCFVGQPTRFTDINNVATAFTYGTTTDARMDKLIKTTRAQGTTEEAATNYEYGLTLATGVYVETRSALRTAADDLLKARQVFDGLGRGTEERQWNGSAWVITKREYDGAHRVKRVSNPTSTGAYVYTVTDYDALGRPVLVTAPDGAKTTYLYALHETTVTDPAGVQKRSAVDGLGRLVGVVENPGAEQEETRYAYNALDLLQTVCPPGGTLSAAGLCSGVAQARSFGYDWLGRLRSAANPESGTISYEYDEAASTNGAGQLTSKSQLRGVATPVTVTTRYHYDNLGRMVSKTYTGAPNDVATPGVTYTYDVHNPAISGVTSYAKGRRTRAEVAGGGTVVAFDSFDAVGRVTRSRQVTGGVTYRFGDDVTPGYTYLRNGALASQRNPSGRQMAWTYDDAGRPTGVSAGGTTYVSAVTYADHGAVATMRLGGQRIRETMSYDPLRLQLTGIDVVRCADNAPCLSPEARWSAAYGYVTNATGGTGSGPNNNGNPRWQDIVVPGASAVQQTYSFDKWNRLETFTEGALSETNCYDAHGNRAVVQRAGLTPMTPQVTAPCTKASVAAIFPGSRVAGVAYDVSGGVAADGRSNLRYNAEDLVAKSWPAVGAATETVYEYDADGRRVAMVIGAARTTYVNDAGGALAAEYGGTVAAEMAGTSYVHVDALGSTRLLLDGDGMLRRRVDYWPFGVEISGGETAWRTAALGYAGDGEPRVKFTGKERDAETGLDYFGARYLSAAQGRFTSPDAPFADQSPGDPQSWNLYGYVRNSPLSWVDPNGRELRLAGDRTQALKYLCEIYGGNDCNSRLSYDQQSGTVTFNSQEIDLSLNEGARLLNDLVSSGSIYQLSIGESVPTAAGSHPLSGLLENLDKNPDPRYQKQAVNLPPPGIDDVVALNSKVIRISGNKLQPAKLSSILFHELSEAYAKVDGGLPYGTGHPGSGAHGIAIERETLLRRQRPGLYHYNFGGVPQTTFFQKLPKNKVRYLSGPTVR